MAPASLTPIWRASPDVHRILAALGAPAVDVRFVGGSVRDAVMGHARADAEIDIGTPETPERVVARLTDAGIKSIPTGLAHGTVTAIIGARPFEITTLRRDTACDGRHAVVEFTTDWHEDARRRDFTMNALSLDADGALYDDHGGVADAHAGRVRFVGDPDDRIKEDYLRILRLFRFVALYGREPIDTATLDACRRNTDGLARLSAERVQNELVKLLGAPDPSSTVAVMERCGVLAALMPEHDDVAQLARLIAAERAIHISDHAWTRRFAALVPSKAIDAVAARLKLSNAASARLKEMCAVPLSPQTSNITLRGQLFRDGATIVMDRLLLAQAAAAQPADWQRLAAMIAAWTPHPLPVSGADVLACGIAPGPDVGRILETMTAWWIEKAFVPTRAEAQVHLRTVIGLEGRGGNWENVTAPPGGAGPLLGSSFAGGRNSISYRDPPQGNDVEPDIG